MAEIGYKINGVLLPTPDIDPDCTGEDMHGKSWRDGAGKLHFVILRRDVTSEKLKWHWLSKAEFDKLKNLCRKDMQGTYTVSYTHLDAVAKMDEAEVPTEGRILYITPTGLRAIQDLDTTKSREVLTSFAAIVKVPQARFYTAIKSLSGGTGEEKGGFEKATAGKDLNFQIVHPSALMPVSYTHLNRSREQI